MNPRPLSPIFGVTHPLGLPRPIVIDNIFGATLAYFAGNFMPVPSGCLSHFDGAVYRPYVAQLAAVLATSEFGWSGPALLGDPPRYALLCHGVPTAVPEDLLALLPAPPKVSFRALLDHFDRTYAGAPPMELLDVLTLISEDIGAIRFAAAAIGHDWVRDFMR